MRTNTKENNREILNSLLANRDPLYKVFKVGRKSQRRQIIRKNPTEAEAQRLVNSYPNSSRSMVCYTKQ